MSHLGDYLAFVLPWGADDYKVIATHWIPTTGDDAGKKIMMQRAARTPEDLEALIRYYNSKQTDTWVALQSYDEAQAIAVGSGQWYKNVRRTRQNVSLSQVFYADLDVKPEAYSDVNSAYQDILRFCGDVNLPQPSMMVVSGGGLHCYWRVDTPLRFQDWMPIAHALGQALRLKGVKCDTQCTVDAVRILRPPETLNYKYNPPKPVQLTAPPPYSIYSVDEIRQPLLPFAGPTLVAGTHVQNPSPKPATNALVHNFTAGLTQSAPPVDLYAIADQGCEVMADALDTHGALHSQPLWSLLAFACTFDETPDETFLEMSSGHPGYVEALALQKLQEKKNSRANFNQGWPKCTSFAVETSACRACQHWGKVNSPLNLMSLVQHAQGLAALQANVNRLPPNYFVDLQTGHLCTNVTDVKGATQKQTVLEYPVGEAWLMDGGTGLILEVIISGKTVLIPVPSTLSTGADIGKLFTKVGATIRHEHWYKHVRDFVMAWINLLQKSSNKAIKLRKMGWDGETFTYGPYTYEPGGKTEVAYSEPIQHYTPTGALQPWLNAVKLVTDQKRPAIEAIVATAFAGPIVKLMGAETPMVTCYSTESGTGKSTSMKIAQAVWGHPIGARNGLSDTSNFLMHKVANLQHLPVYYDEIKTDKEEEKLVAIAFQIGQGAEKARLNQLSQAQDRKTFASMLVAAANASIADMITEATSSTSAGAVRVFELDVPIGPPTVPTSVADRILSKLEDNYGRAGELYAEYIVTHRVTIETMLDKVGAHFRNVLSTTQEERFWLTAMTSIYVGAFLANVSVGTSFDLPALEQYLIGEIYNLRNMRNTAVRDITKTDKLDDLIGYMLSTIKGKNLLETDIITVQGSNPTVKLRMQMETVNRLGDVWAQWAIDMGIVRVKQAQFRQWLRDQRYDQRHVVKELSKHGMVESWGSIGECVPGFNPVRGGRRWDIDMNKLKPTP